MRLKGFFQRIRFRENYLDQTISLTNLELKNP
jgi:hypothetical protein